MQLKAKQAFSWAHGGVRVESFEAGQVIETDDADLIEVATREGWAEKARAAAPENKDAAPKRNTKAKE